MNIQQAHRHAFSPEAAPLYVVNQHGHYFVLEKLRVDRDALQGCRLFDTFAEMKAYLVAEQGYDSDDVIEGVTPLRLFFDPQTEQVVEEDIREIVTPLDDTIERYISDYVL